MSTEDILYLTEQIVTLRQIHNFSLKTVLRNLNITIAIYHARNRLSPDIQLRMERKVVKLTENINALEKLNEKIQTRLDRLEKTFDVITKQKTTNK